MKLYQRLITPILYYPGQSYEPLKKYLEDKWYPEEQEQEVLEKYRYLEGSFYTLSVESKYVEYK